MLAVTADRVLKGASTYKTLLMWVYAIAPPVAGLIGIMLFDNLVGPIAEFFRSLGWTSNSESTGSTRHSP